MDKKTIKRIFNNILRLPSSLLRLPNYIDDVKKLNRYKDDSSTRIKELEDDNHKKSEYIDRIQAQINSHNDRLSSFTKQLDMIRSEGHKSSKPSLNYKDKERFADDHSMDDFYVAFEDRFRGEESEIFERVKVYPEYYKKLEIDYKKYPIVDIGSGRGELLHAFKDAKIRAIGLDINYEMIERSKKNGFEAVQGDALDYLRDQKDNSLGGVTGVHIIEHIPFKDLFELLQECNRVLVPGGAVAFETPNPESVIVGSHTFYKDPSHLKPLPPSLVEFTLDYVGLIETNVMRLHPNREIKSSQSKLLNDVAQLVYGPMDYIAIGRKPGYKK